MAFDADTGRLDVVPDAPVVGTKLRWSAPKLIAAANETVTQANVRALHVLTPSRVQAGPGPRQAAPVVPVQRPAPPEGYRLAIEAHRAAAGLSGADPGIARATKVLIDRAPGPGSRRPLLCNRVLKEDASRRPLFVCDHATSSKSLRGNMWFEKPLSQSRQSWSLNPLISVGPLRFGMHAREVTSILGSDAGLLSNGSAIFADFQDQGITAYYSERNDLRLVAVAVDPLSGPQVSFGDEGLTGRLPSELDPWIDRMADLGHELLFTSNGQPSLRDLGILLLLRPNGDRSISLPVFLGGQWLDSDWEDLPIMQ
ncbi:hypothetical protein ABZW32_15005 [Streptomyces sp. NPDC004667]|uniref:hypothetical protein n=1 Tax=Streptomyces sp. NPDC004667 TaxID=3154285 RepID=UPI0033AF5B73